MCGVSIGCIWFLHGSPARHPGACGPPASSSRRRLGDRIVRGLPSRNLTHPSLDADRHPETSHLVRHVPQHPLPRVLPSPRLPALRVATVVAYTRLLRAYCCALPPRARHSSETPVLGASARRALADQLAPNQSWSVTSRRNVGTQMHRGMPMWGCVKRGTHLLFAFDWRHQTTGCVSRSMSTQFVMAGTKWKHRLDVLIGSLFCTKPKGGGLWPRKLRLPTASTNWWR